MFSNSNKISLSIIGKPNSGKSTLFNCLLGEYISDVGDEYGLTKNLLKEKFNYKNFEFSIIDTPGLRRRNKVLEQNEISRNNEVINLLGRVEVIILLIDSLENITKQDLKLADISIDRNKIIFFIFNKIDLIEDKSKFKKSVNNYLKNRYDKYRIINIEFISAKKNLGINKILNQIIQKKNLTTVKLHKNKLNKFIKKINKNTNIPKINKVIIKPKYIVQTDYKIPKFKVFINSKKRAPKLFQKFFDNVFRKFFELEGIPVQYEFISSKNPFSS